jgi:ATP-binding cassette subfamily B protein
MLIRVFSSEITEINKFNKSNEVFKNKSLQVVKYFAFLFPIINMSLYLGQLLVLFIGGRAAIYGEMSLGQISAFNMLVVMFTAPFIIISFIMNFISQAFVSLKRINDLLETKIEQRQGNLKIKEFKQLEVKDVDYIRNKTNILKGMNLVIKKGEKIGIIGSTASGKSSLMKVLLGILEIAKGQILINNKNLNLIDLASYQGLFGYVAQTPQVFTGSIKENIKFYRDLNQQDLQKAVDVAMVSEFTDKFENGLNSEVSERGTNLSGGQKQRIVLARALAGSPQILILDDATAKLDSVTEKEVFKRIKQEYPHLAIINVASKISSLKDSNRIYVLDKGKVVANGTHDELKKTSYLYQEIELSQSNYHA